jgi:hypothetical protein
MLWLTFYFLALFYVVGTKAPDLPVDELFLYPCVFAGA